MLKKLFDKLNWNSLKVVSIFTSGNIIVAIVGAASGVLYGRWIEPGTLGEFNKYGILTGYLGFGIIFVDGAFQRHFPYYLGKGEKEKALEVASQAKWWYLFLVIIGSFIFFVLAVRSALIGNWKGVTGWSVQIVAYTVATYGLYLKILYRSNDDFLKMNKNMLMTAGGGLVLLPLVYFYQFFGLAYRSIGQKLINIYTHAYNAPYKVKSKFDLNGLIRLAKVSLPLQVPVYLDNHLIKATISLVILNYLGQEALGIYGMALILQGFLLVLSRSISQIFTTKILLNFGKHDDLHKTFKYIIKPTLLASFFGLMIVVGFVLVIEPVISFVIPKYLASVAVVQVLSIELFLALIRTPTTLFISALMYKEMIILRVVKAIFTLGLLFYFNDSLVHIAWIIIGATAVHIVLGYIVLLYKLTKLPPI